MVSLEQVKLLESKVTQAIDYVKKVTGENLQLKEKLAKQKKRVEELEAQAQQYKENQSRIEDGILSALDRLNQFEDALEVKFTQQGKPALDKPAPEKPAPDKPAPEKAKGETAKPESQADASPSELDIF